MQFGLSANRIVTLNRSCLSIVHKLKMSSEQPPVVETIAETPVSPAAQSKNHEKNEAKRQAKLEKQLAKQAKQQQLQAAQAANAENKKKKTATPTVQAVIPETPAGEKKDMSQPMANGYDPIAVESAWYSWWEKQGFFKPSMDENAKKFVVPIPPPNVTGSLHLGHALTGSIQDCMIRWNRMHGHSALYVPGIDHAGIATQVVVEKKLMRERNITRHDIGRDEFVNEVWKWKNQYGDRIYNQFKRLGTSNDWDRARFTMDPSMNKAVVEAFVTLHEEGIIYRENRLVNWCTKLKTALSNLEVEMKELEGRTLMSVPDHDPKKKYEFGVIISFAYKVENSDQEIIVATTRLETMLGDTAIAVHPNDARYKDLVGKFVVHPFNHRRIPIIADDYVDPEFGTGAVKITPAHDFNDYTIGRRHNLEFINIFTDEGKVNENGAQFAGLQRFDAREAVQAELKKLNLYKETKDNKMMLPICDRSGNIVEPLMKPQWWVRCQPLAEPAMEAVRNGTMEIVPQASEKEWFRWLENIQDWCISRQLWWGHRVPAYHVQIQGRPEMSAEDEKNWVSGRTVDEALKKAMDRFNVTDPSLIKLEQDPDVLDTWFSAGLWPFSTLGWPDKTEDYKLFYPTSLLETGWDILFFWVARMVMMGIKFTGQVPFKKVFCHAMVRDAHGRKMSKSLGNVIDPIDVIEGITLAGLQKRLDDGNLDPREVTKAKDAQKKDFPSGIPQCGADALRFTLLSYTSAGRDINLDVMRIEGYRKFCNKLWNATKFALMKLGDDFKPKAKAQITGNESLAEKWILAKLDKAVREVDSSIKDMNFMNATSAAYTFWLYQLCDVYIEAAKVLIDDPQCSESAKDTLYTCLEEGLKLLHPIMPFVTEELYQRLPRREGDTTPSICISSYPVPVDARADAVAESNFEQALQVIFTSRSLITDYSIKGATVYVQSSSAEKRAVVESQRSVIMSLIGTKNVNLIHTVSSADQIPSGCAVRTISEDCVLHLMVRGFVDFDKELEKLADKLAKTQVSLDGFIKKTKMENYEEKVAPEAKEVNANKIKQLQTEIEAIQGAVQNFKALQE